MPATTEKNLHLSQIAPRIIQSEIRSMTVECDAVGGVNMAQGVCDTPLPEVVMEAAIQAIRDGYNIYTRLDGVAVLREAIADKFERHNGLRVDPDKEILVASGATGAMSSACLALFDPGDQVILFEPFYGYHYSTLVSMRVEPVVVPMEPATWEIDFDRLRAAIGPRTRAVMINSPGNPCGKVFTRPELEAIAALAIEHDLFVLTDEIYEYFIYEGQSHISPATIPGMAERTITISGISKSYSVTGWRVGYAVAPPELSVGIRRAHDFVTVGAPHPLQEAAITALRFPDAYYVGLREGYQKRRDLLWEYIQTAGFVAWKPSGAYYILTDAAHFMKAVGVNDDYAFAMWLIKECGVATVPGSSFYAHTELGRTKIRFCFPKTDDILREAGERLQKLRSLV